MTVEKGGYCVLFVNLPTHKRALKAHLVAWLLHYGVWPEREVDHVDQDKTNNRIDNLRLSTGAQNKANSHKYRGYGGKPCSSQYKGVHWNKGSSSWQAHIRVGKKLTVLGYFDDEREAALAYDTAARHHYGSFAVLNFPADVATPPPSGQGDVSPLSDPC